MTKRFLLIPHLKILNANAMSSPYTIGFPAMTAWLGAIHALQRQVCNNPTFSDIRFNSVAVSCHQFDLQTYKGQGDFVHSIVGTANPLDKNGERPPFVEEARCHLKVSLLVQCQGLNTDDLEQFNNLINQQIPRMKWASGDALSVKPVEQFTVDEDQAHEVKAVLNKLMLGYVLKERRDLMINAMQEGKDALDALLGYLIIMHRSHQGGDGKGIWTSLRKTQGWIVPIAVGYQGISELGQAKHQRDLNTTHRFAESVVTLGEFVMPYRINDLDDILWRYHVDIGNNLYLCTTLSS